MPALSKSLVPIVFSPQCERATRYAAALTCRFRSELILVHVVVPPLPLIPAPQRCAAAVEQEDEAALDRIRTQLHEFLRDDLCGLSVRREIYEGEPDQMIVDIARTEACNLIVMPTHGYGLFRRLLLGSVTAKVLHDAACPVLTGPHLQTPLHAWPSFQSILCAIDLGPQSRAVVEWGSWLAAHLELD